MRDEGLKWLAVHAPPRWAVCTRMKEMRLEEQEREETGGRARGKTKQQMSDVDEGCMCTLG